MTFCVDLRHNYNFDESHFIGLWSTYFMFILSMMYLFKTMAYEWEPDAFKLCQARFSMAITHYFWDAL